MAKSAVISLRVPKKLKELMDSVRDMVNWNEEIRRFIEERGRRAYRLKVLDEVEKLIEELPEMSSGTASKLVREDRDSH